MLGHSRLARARTYRNMQPCDCKVLSGTPLSSTALLRNFDTCNWIVPIDHWTGCGDFFELASGIMVMTDDKPATLYMTSFREDRLRGAIRRLYQVPTQSMVEDALTKSMYGEQIIQLLRHGTVRVENKEEHQIRVRIIPSDTIRHDFGEKDLASEQAMFKLKGN